ncbi:metallophosphoesterase [Virgibacillus oceani]
MVLPGESDETLKEKLMNDTADVFIYSHVHRPYIRYIGGECVVNTGRTGLPFDGQRKASYLILKWLSNLNCPGGFQY